MELPITHFCLPKVKEFHSNLESSIKKIPLIVLKDKEVGSVKKFSFLDSLIELVGRSSKEEIKNATGKLSDLIGELANNIDWNHPYMPDGISSLNDASFEKFISIIKEQIHLHQRCKSEYPFILNLVSEALINLKEFKSIKNNLLKLSSSVRVFSNQEVRDKIRLKKKQKVLSYLESYSANEVISFWLSLPYDNLFLCRGTSRIGYFTRDVIGASSIYEKQGLLTIANHLKHNFTSTIFVNGTKFEDVKDSESYHGFCRIKMGRAALTIAKLNGFALNAIAKTPDNPTGFSLVAGKNSDYFKQFGFRSGNESYIISSINGIPTTNESYATPYTNSEKIDIFRFAPRAYPLHVFSDIRVPEHVSKIISWCESCPEIENRALFDHYWIVVPGIAMGSGTQFVNSNFNHIVINPDKKVSEFNNLYDATTHLDKTLIENNLIFPAVLGEKDGRCYFITIWG